MPRRGTQMETKESQDRGRPDRQQVKQREVEKGPVLMVCYLTLKSSNILQAFAAGVGISSPKLNPPAPNDCGLQ